MEIADVNRSILVVIDLQGKLAGMVHRPDLVLAANQRLMKLADLFGVPVVLTEQYPEGLGCTHPEVQEVFDSLKVPKRLLKKNSFGCYGDPRFEETLRELLLEVARPLGKRPSSQRQLVVGGIETHVCVMQTVLEALRFGNQVHLCWEATSGRGAEYRQWALERMQQAGAVVTNHESLAFEWARNKNHPQFKAMSRMLKEGQLVGG